MSTSYYMRLKDDAELNGVRRTLEVVSEQINKMLEMQAEVLYKLVTEQSEKILEKDNFNKQFCNAADWYGGYPDEPEDYHLKLVNTESIETIEVLIGTYFSGEFHWKLNSLKDGYYDLETVKDNFGYDMWKEHKCFEFPRSKEQFKAFMKKYKDKVEIVDEYNEVFTTTEFLKKVGEY